MDSLRIAWLSKDRVGLDIVFELSYNDKLVQSTILNLPVEQSSLIKLLETNHMTEMEMSLIQEKSLSGSHAEN